MRTPAMLLIWGLLGLAACGDSGEERATAPDDGSSAMAGDGATATPASDRRDARPKKRGTRLRVAGSAFGTMLFDSRRQAIYVFERDGKDKSACYGECAKAWPPVFTDGKPVAGRGVKARLLGTIKRRGGAKQVTYAGRPLYFYVNEGPGQVLCHNVDLNGGLWWVVGPNGEPRP
jgi:predicted lipoprotein with Yx(FWY)xxD motif